MTQKGVLHCELQPNMRDQLGQRMERHRNKNHDRKMFYYKNCELSHPFTFAPSKEFQRKALSSLLVWEIPTLGIELPFCYDEKFEP